MILTGKKDTSKEKKDEKKNQEIKKRQTKKDVIDDQDDLYTKF